MDGGACCKTLDAEPKIWGEESSTGRGTPTVRETTGQHRARLHWPRTDRDRLGVGVSYSSWTAAW